MNVKLQWRNPFKNIFLRVYGQVHIFSQHTRKCAHSHLAAIGAYDGASRAVMLSVTEASQIILPAAPAVPIVSTHLTFACNRM